MSRCTAALLALLVGAGGASAARAQGTGTPLVQETFTQATAPDFTAVGDACLTGAPTGAAPGPDGGPGGCPAGAVGPVPPNDAAPHGYLRLTDAGNGRSGAVLYDQAIPARAGLDVSFDQWQYGSTTPDAPADGISFFLVDGAASLTGPGGYGGSLGYAQLGSAPGVSHGYVGVGLDVYGNFFGDTEGRGTGCPEGQRSPSTVLYPPPGPDMVTVRGPGDGTEGYCFLTATTSNFTSTGPWPSTLPGDLQGPTTTLPPDATPQEAETLLEPSRRRVHVRITPAPDPVLTVSIDFMDGNGEQLVLTTPAPQPVPATYKFGFASSTGGSTDVHLIRNVVVSSVAPLSQLNLVKQAQKPLPEDLGVGARVPFEFVVTNSGAQDITGLVVDDPRADTVECPTTELASGQTITCTATYTVTEEDAARGSLDNTAVASGTAGGTPVGSPPSTSTVPIPVQPPPPALEVAKSATTPGPYTEGQPITYSYTVTNTGGSELTGVQVRDNRVDGITCVPTTLAPAQTATCTGTYTVTAADAERGSVTNTASATGRTADGDTITSPDTDLTLTVGRTGLTVDKEVVSGGPFMVGSTVEYEYTVTDTGTTTLDDVRVTDDHISDVNCPPASLEPGASVVCHGSYEITPADVEACAGSDECVVTNIARADATDPRGNEVHSGSDDADVVVVVAGPPQK
ncbi:DUF7507 domain-containing protein [Streptomyces smaragdinus]|nr:DUF11 domain-containing protein [Streptomyces smaragdinus]